MTPNEGGNAVPSITRDENRRDNGVSTKAVSIYGYLPGSATPVRISAIDNGDGTYSFLSGQADLLTKIDTTSTANTIYIGKAAIGSSAASAVWQIKRLVTSPLALDKAYADGNANFDNVWNNRVSGYTYS